MSSSKPPTILDPADLTAKSATVIFLHGYDDEADGLPLGLAQQFLFASKLPYIKWILPNAPFLKDLPGRTRAWYLPRSLIDPDVLAEMDADADGETESEETGILRAVEIVDQLVQSELDNGVPGSRLVVGGFSQGCAVSIAYGILGRTAGKVGGIVGLSGYFPLQIPLSAELEKRRQGEGDDEKEWFLAYGTKDMLVSRKLFTELQEKVEGFVGKERVKVHAYEGMGHSTCSAELRDLLEWVERVVPLSPVSAAAA